MQVIGILYIFINASGLAWLTIHGFSINIAENIQDVIIGSVVVLNLQGLTKIANVCEDENVYKEK